jgi:hypothetical protein
MTSVSLESDLGLAARFPEPRFGASSGPARSLAQAVGAAVGQVDARALNDARRLQVPAVFQARSLLALLTFCYARQVYSSNAIAARLRREFGSFRVDGNELPDALMLLLFRRDNRGPLGFCLRSALHFLAAEKVRQGFVTRLKEAHITEEASRRITMAIFTDSVEMEDKPAAISPLRR